MLIFASRSARKIGDFVSQLVEQYTFNVWVLGTSPNGITKFESRYSSGFQRCILIGYRTSFAILNTASHNRTQVRMYMTIRIDNRIYG